MNICIGCLYRSKPTEEGERTCAKFGGVKIEDAIRRGSVSCSVRVGRVGHEGGGS